MRVHCIAVRINPVKSEESLPQAKTVEIESDRINFVSRSQVQRGCLAVDAVLLLSDCIVEVLSGLTCLPD
jgi:hypothetical protein